MIDIALKHFIYDICIDTVFDGIVRNFQIGLGPFTIGSRFRYIKHQIYPTMYIVMSDVEIESFHPHCGQVYMNFHAEYSTKYTTDKDGNIISSKDYFNHVSVTLDGLSDYDKI
jgi:hypothetical protein